MFVTLWSYRANGDIYINKVAFCAWQLINNGVPTPLEDKRDPSSNISEKAAVWFPLNLLVVHRRLVRH